MFEATTQDIHVQVEPAYIEDQSNPQENYWFFAYSIRITNNSRKTIQLLSRHWIISDGFGKTEEVRGPGVVGETPHIGPGEFFEYSSFCPLHTPTGSMRGSYSMVDQDGKTFDIEIPRFILAEPGHFH